MALPRALHALAALLLAVPLAACQGKRSSGLDACAESVGTCHEQSAACGIQFACDGGKRELRCTPPDDAEAAAMDCTCVDNGVLGKQVMVTINKDRGQWLSGDPTAVASTACDWPR